MMRKVGYFRSKNDETNHLIRYEETLVYYWRTGILSLKDLLCYLYLAPEPWKKPFYLSLQAAWYCYRNWHKILGLRTFHCHKKHFLSDRFHRIKNQTWTKEKSTASTIKELCMTNIHYRCFSKKFLSTFISCSPHRLNSRTYHSFILVKNVAYLVIMREVTRVVAIQLVELHELPIETA